MSLLSALFQNYLLLLIMTLAGAQIGAELGKSFCRAPGLARVSCRDSLQLSRCDLMDEYSVIYQICADTKQPQGAFGAIPGQLSGVLHGIGQSHGTAR
jgi:hypothetical protein